MASVDIRGIEKSYGTLKALHGVSIQIDHGEFVTLVGPSGCGKSTLLRMLAGLEEIDGGTIRIAGAVVNDLPPKDRDIAMVFQNYALYPHMTVAQNMGFALKLKNADRREIRDKVERAARILNLDTLLERFPRQLSGGQRQRVAMGRAIVRDPKVFLFDEPLSNLDAKLRVTMRAEIKNLHQRLGTTTVYVTHDQVEAMTMADKIVVMRDGLVEQVGAPLALYDEPTNMFVAGFIGSPAMNFLTGGIGEGGFAVGDVWLPLPEHAQRNWVGGSIVYGIRPEHIRVGGEGIAAEIRVVEPTGAETYLIAGIGGQEITCVVRDRLDVKVGQKVRLSPDPSRVHLFDPASERRL
jgi:multiple sugar transport system ATP-binding protein